MHASLGFHNFGLVWTNLEVYIKYVVILDIWLMLRTGTCSNQ